MIIPCEKENPHLFVDRAGCVCCGCLGCLDARFLVASAVRGISPGRCIELYLQPQTTRALDQGGPNHGKLSARGPEAEDDTASLQRRLFVWMSLSGC